jgi:hypothetical protein
LFTRGSKGVYGQLWMKNNTQRCLKSSVTSQSSADSFAGDNIPHCESTAVREARARRTAPFPFLEFRMVNDHANYKNRAVLHARVNASTFLWLCAQVSAYKCDFCCHLTLIFLNLLMLRHSGTVKHRRCR